jgi:hypothetical protein
MTFAALGGYRPGARLLNDWHLPKNLKKLQDLVSGRR